MQPVLRTAFRSVMALGLFAATALPAHSARSRRLPPPAIPRMEVSRYRDDSAASLERRRLQLVAQERAGRGLPELTPDAELAEAARDHSREMNERGFFDHDSPAAGRRTPTDRYAQV